MDIKEALNMWQDIPFTWMRKFNIVKMSNLPRWMHKSNTIPKTQWHFLLNLTVNSEVHMGEMYIKIAKRVLKKKNEPCMCVWELGLTERKATSRLQVLLLTTSGNKISGRPFLVVGGGLTPVPQEGWHVVQAWPLRGAHTFSWRGMRAIKDRLIRVQPRHFFSPKKLLGKMTSFLVVIKLLSGCAQGYQWLSWVPGGDSAWHCQMKRWESDDIFWAPEHNSA